MATLVLQTAGAVVGGLVGGPFGAMVGRALGGLAGAAIDGAILSSLEGESTRTVVGPRLTEMPGLASTEGAPIPRVYGRARIGGQVIWATRLEEETRVTIHREPKRGGKSSGGGRSSTTREVTYAYYANLAIGLCEGPIAFVRRVFADGREIDLAGITMRVYTGDEVQAPDPLIVAKEGVAPAYRGFAYVVFERLALEPFGNRIPQLAFEVVRGGNALGEAIRAVCLIPGATEFGYEPAPVRQALGLGETKPDNRHQLQATSDVLASLDQLQALCPNLSHVFLVVSWFGDDLRAGSCTIAPRVEIAAKDTGETPWAVAGLERASARVVSTSGGLPAYGGTPSDASVVRLIRILKQRGLAVTLYPFQMMDVPAGNALPDPRTGAIGQPPYPWRGRITCDPAPGRPGSPDGSSLAAAQVAAFFGTAQASHFAPADEGVIYTGPEEWTLRRQILHYAALAQAAGGVDAIVIGTELPALTRVRAGPGGYPAVDALCALAAEVRTLVGPGTKITYAADWTEYGAHVRDGGAEVRFPLDPLWAHPAIDAIGIDWYPPISDWRDEPSHLDQGEARGGLDPDYLHARLGAGEAFDWFYADAAARAAQVRTPIADALGDDFAFRAKDLVGWWSSPHRERVGGVVAGQTAYVPGGKPIWLTEIGVPAVDKGPNGPNVFPDPKSAESAYPPFSAGARDDLAQARGVGAILRRFDPRVPGHEPAHNPLSASSGVRMIDPDRMAVWAFDARPFPAFPELTGVWSDGANHETGHWLNGRLEGLPLDELIRRVLAELGVDLPVETDCDGFVDGFVIDRPMSAREALEPLLRLFSVDAVERDGALAFVGRGARAVATIAAHERVEEGEGALERRVRAQETDLPAEIELAFTDAAGTYRRATVASRRLAGGSRRLARVETAAVLRRAQARGLADVMLQDAWSGREGLTLSVSPRRVDLEPGDVIAAPGGGLYRIGRIVDAAARRIDARAVEPTLFAAPAPKGAIVARAAPATFGRPFALVLDLPAALGDPTVLSFAAIHARPWPGAMTIWRSGDGASFEPFDVAAAPAQVGETLSPLAPGPLWRIDEAGVLDVRVATGAVTSVSDHALLEGANRFALRAPDGRLEIIGVGTAELTAERTYRLSRLLRGLAGSEPAAALGLPAGSALVRLDEALVPLARAPSDLGRTWRWRIGPADRDHADDAVVEIVATAGPAALLPLAPVHASARRTGEGIALAWVRRARLDADAWDPVDPPLGEAMEAWCVEILSAGGAVVRTLAATSPQVLYPVADELADHGGQQPTLTVRIAQESALVGPGTPLVATLAVR
ncbi:baseplate multidomain protein megatron [Salinarimonas sp. NSM]|uniref:baseplate multidomain protein megatron n=1 Tax=Salinarimonas sp. NSM TaxID=3458003 RepID=UPI0040353E7F